MNVKTRKDCKHCGKTSQVHRETGSFYCVICGSNADVRPISKREGRNQVMENSIFGKIR
jgi:uncharacterized Zn finger protein (UPF0148 family)